MVRAASTFSITVLLASFGQVCGGAAGDFTAALSLDDECARSGAGDVGVCALELAQLRVARHVKAAPAMVERGFAMVKDGLAMVEEMKHEVEKRTGFANAQDGEDGAGGAGGAQQPVTTGEDDGAVLPFPKHAGSTGSSHAESQESATLVSQKDSRSGSSVKHAEHLHIGPAEPEEPKPSAASAVADPHAKHKPAKQPAKLHQEKQPEPLQAANKYGHPSWVQDCKVMFIDVGANNGVSVRKMFEPKKYPEAELLAYMDKHFGSPGWRRAGFANNGVCALGLEPNPVHQERLRQIEAAYAQSDWMVHFYPIAAWSEDGEMLFNMTGPRLPGDGSDEASAGAHLAMKDAAGIAAQQAEGLTTVRTVNFAQFLESLPAGVVRLVQMDIEGAEYETLAQLMTENKLCKSTIANMLVAPHDWGEIGRWGQKSSFPHEIHPRSMSAIGSRVDQMTEMAFCAAGDNVTYIAEFDDTSFDDDVDDAFGR